MQLNKLSLTCFRSWESFEIDAKNKIVVFIGENAAGKTNIIEAINYISSFRSHRTAFDSDMVRANEQSALIHCDFTTLSGREYISASIDKSGKKYIKYNGTPVKRLYDVVGRLNTVIFSPDDIEIIDGAPEERRRFIDIAISKIDKTYFYSLQLYKKLLRQRNKLLKMDGFNKERVKTLEAYDIQLSLAGAAIITKRVRYVQMLSNRISEIANTLSDGNDKCSITYKGDIEPQKTEEEMRNRLIQMYEASRERDIREKNTSHGPHRDEYVFNINTMSAKKYSSQGQKRTFVLSMIFAQTEIATEETGEEPILILDDVMSELDSKRQSALMQYIKRSQTFITATDLFTPIWGKDADCAIYKVANGKIKKYEGE